jgi:hypothetical protein
MNKMGKTKSYIIHKGIEYQVRLNETGYITADNKMKNYYEFSLQNLGKEWHQ